MYLHLALNHHFMILLVHYNLIISASMAITKFSLICINPSCDGYIIEIQEMKKMKKMTAIVNRLSYYYVKAISF